MYNSPLEVKESYGWEAVEINPKSNILAESIIARYLPVVDWMEFNYDNTGWDHSIKVIGIHCEVLSILLKLKIAKSAC